MANPVLEKQFGKPAAADAAPTTAPAPESKPAGRMTIGSVIAATFFLLLLVSAGAIFGWNNAATVWQWWWALAIGLILLIILTVAKPHIAPFTGIVYSITQGAFIGALSKQYESFFDGIVFLALLATIAVFLSMLFLYATGIVRVTEKVRSVIIIATVGIGLFYLLSFLLSLFGIGVPVIYGAGTPALVFSIVVVVVAALNLLLDFAVIEHGIAMGAPKSFSWFAAFGLMVTIVWLYIEILRLLAILAARRG